MVFILNKVTEVNISLFLIKQNILIGNKRLFNGLLKSDRIKSLNLSWNAIGVVPAVKPLTRYLKKSQSLEELDISNNRYTLQQNIPCYCNCIIFLRQIDR